MDRGIWGVYSPWVTMSRTELSNQHFTLLVLKHHLFKFPPKNTQYFTLKKKNSSSCLSLWYSISLESAIFLLLYWFLPFDMGERNFSIHFFESKWKTVRLGQNSLTNNVVCCWLLEGKRKLVIISSPYHTPINQLRWLCVLFTCPLTIACSHAM